MIHYAAIIILEINSNGHYERSLKKKKNLHKYSSLSF